VEVGILREMERKKNCGGLSLLSFLPTRDANANVLVFDTRTEY